MISKKSHIYKSLCKGFLSLSDHLATIRSILANERTLLSYIRTALTLFVAGVSFIKFFGMLLLTIIGWGFIFVGFVTLIVGIIKYKNMKVLIQREEIEVLLCKKEVNGD